MGFQTFPDFDVGVSLLPRGFSRDGYAYAPVAFRGGETSRETLHAAQGSASQLSLFEKPWRQKTLHFPAQKALEIENGTGEVI